jgi:hypothetical protein
MIDVLQMLLHRGVEDGSGNGSKIKERDRLKTSEGTDGTDVQVIRFNSI